VHKGMYKSWGSLRNQTIASLTALGCDSKPLRITGHSLGGGMSALAAVDLATNFTIKHVYTFGQPRTGNQAWVDMFMKMPFTYFRIVNYMDPVPRLPPKGFLSYKHAGPEVFYNATRMGSYHICPSGEDSECGDQFGLIKCTVHGCDHCSYLGLNPCDVNANKSECTEPKGLLLSAANREHHVWQDWSTVMV